MIIVGSGIMAENLTNDNALRLTANTLATGAGLFVLITAFANVAAVTVIPPSTKLTAESAVPLNLLA